MELVDGQPQRASSLCSLAYSPGRCPGTILDHCFLNRILPFLCAVMLGDGDRHICVQKNHKLFIAVYIFKQQKKISFSYPLSQETEFLSALFMQLTNEKTKSLIYYVIEKGSIISISYTDHEL